ncbi:multiple epidermal growth factor-like domains protein 11 [Gigantopelta aegis]|uniref:multiple epidermal growth factor-like domains protein 11 n=1 Tax=Gigantopelta aegis TaxID=1735272 RepID=UPI001B88C3E3|nr:multiple epidermal growth factor-like domains protein 11 [Gigantopelta aegis]
MSEHLICIFVFTIWACCRVTSGVCPDGRYGLHCSYTCHCTSGCDDVTGCSGNCKKGWSGPTCNMNNLALYKLAYQSSHYNGANIPPSAGVNGDYTLKTGILTDPYQNNSWWEVDLGKPHYIHNVTVHFRMDYPYRRNGVHVYSSLTVNQSNTGHLCGAATINSPDVTRITCDTTAQYITLYQGTNNTHGAGTGMDFCEVEVFICDGGTFGDNCTEFCHCQGQPCNYVTGECFGGCKQNWNGTQCKVCDIGHYGFLCNASCSSRHCDNTYVISSCDNGIGKCDNGCQTGWSGVDCTQKCSTRSYGKDCNGSCINRHCLGNSPCDHVTGKCIYGCDRGYALLDCATNCSGDYGFNCNMSCSSRNCYNTSSECDQFYGSCTGTCLDGFELQDCATECRGSTFGSGCKFRCSERHCDGDSTTCDAESGTCQNGCTPGWKKPSCMKPCDTGRYGADCSFICTRRRCLNKAASCDHVTGSCGGECEENWIGEDCTECDGKYGSGCSYSCSERKCRDPSAPCDHVTGSCNGGCLDGWQGDTCTTTLEISQNDSGSTIIALAVALGIVSILLIALAGVFFWHVRRYKMTPGSTTRENSSVANQDGGHYEIVARQTGRERDIAKVDTSHESGYVNSPRSRRTDDVSQRPLGDSDSGYVNAGQDIQLNEYEHLDPSHSPQNVYDKITGN